MPLYRSTGDIKNNKLFTGVKHSVLSSFFDQKEIKEIKEGEMIYRTGDKSDALFLIIKGEVRVKFSANNYVSHKIYNDFFGEKELIEETKRISSAMAFSNVLYYRINKSLLISLMSQDSLIEQNLNNYGEFKLPETNSDFDRIINLTERDKPISFRAFSIGGKNDEVNPKEMEPPAVQTQQLLPDLESIEKSLEEEEINSYEDTHELEEALEELKEMTDSNAPEEVELLAEDQIRKPDPEIQPIIEAADYSPQTKKEIPSFKPDRQPVYQQTETGINREVVRKIFLALNKIYSGINISELIINSKKALKTLTNSESVELIFIDEKLLLMQRMTVKDGKVINETFPLTDNLTGSCALQKAPINYDRPTENKRFDPKVDQPGSARLKRILYFPVLNDAGETIAVIQIARENLKYTEDELSYLMMIGKQLETVITRTRKLEKLLKQEKLSSAQKLKEVIGKEVQVPIEIIDSYTRILNSKKLPSDADDIIRMLQKQANSIEDITDTVFRVLIDDIVLENHKVHFNEFIDDVLELLTEFCEMREIKLFKKIGDGAVVDVDRSKLYTAILQFLKASVEDSRKSGKIYFSTDLLGNTISLTIQNEGKGAIIFPEGDVLDYFYYKEKIKEDEVGLLLAKKIVNAHSGKVEVESIKGVGSTFRILLPVALLPT